MTPVYVATYFTESGDSGVIGYWTEEPTQEQLTALFREWMPEEFIDDEEGSCRYVFWELTELKFGELPDGIPLVQSI